MEKQTVLSVCDPKALLLIFLRILDDMRLINHERPKFKVQHTTCITHAWKSRINFQWPNERDWPKACKETLTHERS